MKKTVKNKYNNYQKTTQITKQAFDLVWQFVVYAYLIFAVLHQTITIGSMTIFLASINKFTSAITTFSNSYIGLVDHGVKTVAGND